MENLVAPVADGQPPARRRPARYDWKNYADGKWHQWRDAPADEDPRESQRAADRLRLAASGWAARRGGHAESRWTKHGRLVWIAIHLPPTDGDR